MTALSAERSADIFDAGLSLCGPIGDFRRQINYWEDFRVLYDYFFPGTLPGDAVNVPPQLIAGWDSVYQPLVLAKLAADPRAAAQLIRTSKAPIDLKDPTTAGTTTAGHLVVQRLRDRGRQAAVRRESVTTTLTRIYGGSLNDTRAQRGRRSFCRRPCRAGRAADRTTRPAIPASPSSRYTRPAIRSCPTGMSSYYRMKLRANGNTEVTQIPIHRYGHCTFHHHEVLVGFGLMVLQGDGTADVRARRNTTSQTPAHRWKARRSSVVLAAV